MLACSTGDRLSSPEAAASKSPEAVLSRSSDLASKPNILLIIADDLGLSDLGSFGGEIETPNLDLLAANGIRFNHFHSTSVCSPSRAMLYTGVDSHKAGLGNMFEELAPNQKGQPGYEGYLNDRVVTVARLLQDAGYLTYFTGKWHLGMTLERSPAARGFGKSFTLLSGAAHHFADMKPAYSPDPNAVAAFRENFKKLSKLPANYQYSTQFFTDRLIQYLDADAQVKKPFFAVLSFMAPHWPLQAPEKAIDKYRGRYDQGFEVIAAQRLQRQQQLGIVPPYSKQGPIPLKGSRWHRLSKEQQAVEIRAMEIYAAMVDQIDYHSGRLFDYLRERQLLDNTLVVFLSDNGAEGHDLDETWPADLYPKIRRIINNRHDLSYDNMGKPNSYVLYGPNWARAGAPALRLHKAFVNEGGIRVPVLMYFPKKLPGNLIHSGQFHIKDLAPTLLSLAEVEHPETSYKGRAIEPMSGLDMLPYIIEPHQLPPQRVEVFEVLGKGYVLDYPWKMLRQPEPYGKGRWELYNLQQDLAETNDMAESYPDKIEELKIYWDAYIKDNNVILPNWLSGY